MRRILHPLAALFLIACDTGIKPEDSAARDAAVMGAPETLTYAPELDVDLSAMTKQPSGLYTQDLTTGTGAEAMSGKRKWDTVLDEVQKKVVAYAKAQGFKVTES